MCGGRISTGRIRHHVQGKQESIFFINMPASRKRAAGKKEEFKKLVTDLCFSHFDKADSENSEILPTVFQNSADDATAVPQVINFKFTTTNHNYNARAISKNMAMSVLKQHFTVWLYKEFNIVTTVMAEAMHNVKNSEGEKLDPADEALYDFVMQKFDRGMSDYENLEPLQLFTNDVHPKPDGFITVWHYMSDRLTAFGFDDTAENETGLDPVIKMINKKLKGYNFAMPKLEDTNVTLPQSWQGILTEAGNLIEDNVVILEALYAVLIQNMPPLSVVMSVNFRIYEIFERVIQDIKTNMFAGTVSVRMTLRLTFDREFVSRWTVTKENVDQIDSSNDSEPVSKYVFKQSENTADGSENDHTNDADEYVNAALSLRGEKHNIYKFKEMYLQNFGTYNTIFYWPIVTSIIIFQGIDESKGILESLSAKSQTGIEFRPLEELTHEISNSSVQLAEYFKPASRGGAGVIPRTIVNSTFASYGCLETNLYSSALGSSMQSAHQFQYKNNTQLTTLAQMLTPGKTVLNDFEDQDLDQWIGSNFRLLGGSIASINYDQTYEVIDTDKLNNFVTVESDCTAIVDIVKTAPEKKVLSYKNGVKLTVNVNDKTLILELPFFFCKHLHLGNDVANTALKSINLTNVTELNGQLGLYTGTIAENPSEDTAALTFNSHTGSLRTVTMNKLKCFRSVDLDPYFITEVNFRKISSTQHRLQGIAKLVTSCGKHCQWKLYDSITFINTKYGGDRVILYNLFQPTSTENVYSVSPLFKTQFPELENPDPTTVPYLLLQYDNNYQYSNLPSYFLSYLVLTFVEHEEEIDPSKINDFLLKFSDMMIICQMYILLTVALTAWAVNIKELHSVCQAKVENSIRTVLHDDLAGFCNYICANPENWTDPIMNVCSQVNVMIQKEAIATKHADAKDGVQKVIDIMRSFKPSLGNFDETPWLVDQAKENVSMVETSGLEEFSIKRKAEVEDEDTDSNRGTKIRKRSGADASADDGAGADDGADDDDGENDSEFFDAASFAHSNSDDLLANFPTHPVASESDDYDDDGSTSEEED